MNESKNKNMEYTGLTVPPNSPSSMGSTSSMSSMGSTSSMSSMGPHTITLSSWISCAPFEKHLGIKIIQAKKGKSILTMPFVYELANGGGVVHGGAMLTLADTAVAMAIKSIVAENSHFGTISLNTEFLAPVTQGMLTAKAFVKLLENRMVDGRCDLYNEDKKKVMLFSSTFKLAKNTEVLI